MSRVLSFAILMMLSTAWALPPLSPYQIGEMRLMIPTGWQVDIDDSQSVMLVSQNQSDPNAPAMMLIALPYQPELTASYLTQTILEELTTFSQELSREEANGVLWTLQQYVYEGTEGLMTTIAMASPEDGISLLALLAATAEDYVRLGGPALLYVSFLGADPAMFATTASLSSEEYQHLASLAPTQLTEAQAQMMMQYEIEHYNQTSEMSNLERDYARMVAIQESYQRMQRVMFNKMSDTVCWADMYGQCY